MSLSVQKALTFCDYDMGHGHLRCCRYCFEYPDTTLLISIDKIFDSNNSQTAWWMEISVLTSGIGDHEKVAIPLYNLTLWRRDYATRDTLVNGIYGQTRIHTMQQLLVVLWKILDESAIDGMILGDKDDDVSLTIWSSVTSATATSVEHQMGP